MSANTSSARDDPDAGATFEALFERYAHVTDAFFRRRIGTPEIAAEENQELWLAVAKHFAAFRGESTVRTWLFRLARNRLWHLRRRWSVHLDERTDAPPEGFWDALRGDDESPDRSVETHDRRRRLRRCIAELPEVERAVVFGQYWEGVTLKELTQALGMDNPSGARATLIAAQRRLRRCLERSGLTA